MEQNGIGSGFWLEGFGNVDIIFYPDLDLKDINLSEEKRNHINKKTLEAMQRICKSIENPSKMSDYSEHITYE